MQDATADIADAPTADAWALDVAHDAVIDAIDGGTGDADVGVFNAIPDASGCVYISDASCTTLVTPSPINVGCVSAPPVPEGGTIQSGVYHLTQADWNAAYFDGSCPTKSTWAGTMEICGNIIEWYDINDVHSDFIGNLVYATSGTQLETNQYCPSGPYYGAFGYTSTNGQLVINYGSSSSVVLIETFTKQ